jgi:hypothetical protein
MEMGEERAKINPSVGRLPLKVLSNSPVVDSMGSQGQTTSEAMKKFGLYIRRH